MLPGGLAEKSLPTDQAKHTRKIVYNVLKSADSYASSCRLPDFATVTHSSVGQTLTTY